MKTKYLLPILVFSALGVQCSDDDGETNEISGNPLPEKNNTPDTLSFNNPSIISGYADVMNAQLIVTGVDSVEVAPEYAYIVDLIQGLGDTSWGTSNATEVFFDLESNSLMVTLPKAVRYSMLCASDNSGLLWLPQWDLIYDWDDSGITISGKGRGSHVPDAIFLYLEQFEAFEASEVIFEFKGVQMPESPTVKGTFSIIEKSPDASFNLAIYGSMAIDFYITF